jgi:predicted RNA-binding protein
MCQLNAYLVRNGHEELVLEDVTVVEVRSGKVFLTTLFQQQESIDARIEVVDSVRNRLLLRANDSEEAKKMADKTEQEKLAIRLHHWIEHNTAHTREFQQGAEMANDLGHHAARDELLLAAEKLNEASECLRRASEKLGESSD